MKTTLLVLLSFMAIVSMTSCKVSKTKKHQYIAGLYSELKDSFQNTEIVLKGDSIKMIFPDDIMFEVRSASIKPTFFERLSKLSAFMKKYDKVNILTNGHTDNTGDEEGNKQLSTLRAENARQIMVQNGAQLKKTYVWGFGAKMPRNANDSEEGKARNRRVEFVLLYPKVSN